MQPQHGLQALAVLLAPRNQLANAAVSPIVWPALLHSRRHLLQLVHEFVEPGRTATAPVTLAITPYEDRSMAEGISSPGDVNNMQQAVMGIIQTVLGSAVEATQPLMEVRLLT